MKLKKFLEFKKSDIDPVIKSFKLQDELNPKIWDGFDINTEVREKLLEIAQDFYNSLELDADVKDITLTGSLSNYNWSKYSDFDLHILIDFKDVNEDVELVKKLVDASKNVWNKDNDIKIEGYDVEVYIQDISEKHRSTGVFSLLNNKWNIKPKKVDFEIDEEMIKEKGSNIMSMVDDLEKESDSMDYEKVKTNVKKIWEKVKKLRQSALEEEGEYGVGNLVFKLLRRNGYIGKLMKLRKEAYEKKFESKC
jgi:hypothetical protein